MRIGTCGRYLRERGIAAAIVVSPANMFYLTGLSLTPHERLAAVLVAADEKLLVVVPDFERDRALEFLQSRQILAWRDGEDPLATLVGGLRVLGVGPGARLGVEKGRFTLDLADRLRAAFHKLEYGDVSPLFVRMRARKSEEEIACIREACRITVAAIGEVLSFIRPGATELEVAARLDLLLASAGSSGSAFRTTVLSGVRSASPHATSSSKEISRGEVVVIDVGGTYCGYCADVTRTVVVGP
ncbi:MAG: Xaa-Pro peptidase family protein, partial [Bacillota bacterium]